MKRTMFNAKIHRATVTHADVDYEGSVTIDEDLLDATGMLENEAIHVWNITQGTRLITYVLKGPRESGVICLNGAAARLNRPGDLVILATFVELDESELANHKPKVVFVDSKNRIVQKLSTEIPGPQRRKAA